MNNSPEFRILLNAKPLSSVLTGVARYSRCLYEQVLQENDALVMFFDGKTISYDIPNQTVLPTINRFPNWTRATLREIDLNYAEHILKRAAASKQFDIYHETGLFPLVTNQSMPVVQTIYDLSLIKNSDTHPKDRVNHFRKHFYQRLQRIDHIITISEYIKHEIVETLNVNVKNVSAIPLAAGQAFYKRKQAHVAQYLKSKNLPNDYILAVGAHEPRKNLKTLLEAIAISTHHPVVVSAGWRGWKSEPLQLQINRLGLENSFISLGHVPDSELALLYSGATMLVFPSLYEGFGLPILEAMSCGCPVICSNLTSMPEVAGNAAWLVSPNDVEELANAIDSVLTSNQCRENLKSKGYIQAKKYNWKMTADKTIDIFKEALQKSG